MNIAAVLNHIRPGEEWALSDNDYDKLIWLSDTKKPTKAELEAAWNSVQTALANADAERARAAAFRSEADPLFFGWQRGENSEQQWLDKVAEIRARHPYA